MFRKAMASQRHFDANTAESMADALFEMGKNMLERKQYDLAVKWLERSYDVLSGQELDKLSIDASELRVSIIESFVRSLLCLQTPESMKKGQNFIELLESEFGDKLVVLVLRMDLITAEGSGNFDRDAYSDALRRIIRCVVMGEDSFKLVMARIRILNTESPSLACKVMDDFIRLRVVKEGRGCWIDKALISRLYMAVCQAESKETITAVEHLVSEVFASVEKPLSSKVTLAAQMVSGSLGFLFGRAKKSQLLWKKIEATFLQGHFDVTEQWCRVSMHRLFGASGEQNTARITRLAPFLPWIFD